MATLIELCQLYINNPCEEREQAIREFLSEKWIPCSKKLPEADGLYLATVRPIGMDWTGVLPARFFVQSGWAFQFYDVLAWMPMPYEYKEEEDV